MRVYLYYSFYRNFISKLLIYFLFSGLIFSIYGTNYYVDRDANGNGNGTSWANAAKKISSLPWNSMQRGDTVYVSGGTDSTTYGASGEMGHYTLPGVGQLVICPSWETGHNGDVWFINQSTPVNKDAFISLAGIPNVKITGFNFYWNSATTNDHNYCIHIGQTLQGGTYWKSDNCTVENCHIISNGNALGIDISYVSFATVTNCTIETVTNDLDHEQELIYFSGGDGGHTITGNTFISRCNDQTHPGNDHPDMFQFTSDMGGTANNQFIIANNFFYFVEQNVAETAGMIYTDGVASNRFLIYNNLMVSKTPRQNNFVLRGQSTHPERNLSIRLLNNTLVCQGSIQGLDVNFVTDYVDTLIMKNNLFYMGDCSIGTGLPIWFMGTSYNDLVYKDIDYNNYYNLDASRIAATSSNDYTFTQWQAAGNDVHGTNTPITFSNLWGTNIEDYLTTTGRDAGFSLSPIFTTDISGTTRPQGISWDLGALENVQGGGNNPPNQPSNPNPPNAATNQLTTLTLSWSCSDPNGDPLTYDVYFGTSNNPPLVAGSLTTTSYNPGQLNNSTTYYWKIVAKDNHAASTSGPLWNFTTLTVNVPPDVPSNPNPTNGSINQSTNQTLSWTCSDPNGDPLTFDIYFGTANNPPLASGNQGNTNYNPGNLDTNTTYYWKIVAKDNHNASTAGPIWHFTTDSPGSMAGAELKVFLEGPYSNNAMITDLDSFSVIPHSQPYNTTPWNYNGTESVSSIPPEIVDWIFIELRTSPTASSVVGRRAAFLRNDGMIVDLNGETKVTFPGVNNGSYYVVARHRNHLAVMSKNPVQLSNSPALYDFTTSQNQAYGSQPMKSLGNGIYGLYSGDGNGNGTVNTADYNTIWKRENGTVGYKSGDFDMNGGVNIVDSNAKWKPNKGKVSQVP